VYTTDNILAHIKGNVDFIPLAGKHSNRKKSLLNQKLSLLVACFLSLSCQRWPSPKTSQKATIWFGSAPFFPGLSEHHYKQGGHCQLPAALLGCVTRSMPSVSDPVVHKSLGVQGWAMLCQLSGFQQCLSCMWFKTTVYPHTSSL